MITIFQNHTSSPVDNAQQNLGGRTHYVDTQTLRFHKSRILSARASANGFLFYLIESVATDYQNTKRGVRFVVFDIFGTVISNVALEDCWRTRQQATKALYKFLETITEAGVTEEAIARHERQNAAEMADLRSRLRKLAA